MNYVLDNFYSEIIAKLGSTAPAKNIEIENPPFPQYKHIVNLMNKIGLKVPKPSARDVDIIKFKMIFLEN